MEVEGKVHLISVELARDELILMISNVFSASTQKDQRDAEANVIGLLNQPGFLDRLLLLLTDQGQMPRRTEFEKATAVLIKKFSYDYAKKEVDKSKFIEALFQLILSDKISFTAKDILGTAMEYQFNQDQEDKYRKAVVENAIGMLEDPQHLNKFQGILIISLAYLNSLVSIQQQIEFFLLSIGNFHLAASNLLKEVSKLSLQEWLYRDKAISPKIGKLFEYIETAVERIIDEQDYYINELKQIRENDFLISILQNYLQLFSNNGSVISLAYPQINEVKRVMINIVGLLYCNYKCPVKIFNSLYITFLVECQYPEHQSTSQAILIKCSEILTMHLNNKYYYKVYVDNLVQTILAIFMYSTTSKQEYQALNNNPEEFSDIAQYYTDADDKYYHLKVKAAVFARVLAEKVDEAMKHIIEILITIMTSTLEISPNDSPIMTEVKSETSKFDIYGLKSEQKLETSFMLLCTLSPYICRRQDVGHLIFAFFISQFEILTKTTSIIIKLRLIRAISCYSISLYFPYIESLIRSSKVFVVEGLRSFQKIVRTNKYAEIFTYLTKTMANLLSQIPITDSLMELIVINNYQSMVKQSPQLYAAVLTKIKNQFYINNNSNEHATLICFNLLYALIKKETGQDQLFSLKQLVFQLTHHLQQAQNMLGLQKYDEKIVEIEELILKKTSYISEQVDRFVKNSLGYISGLQKGTQYFRFYSNYIFRLSGCTYKLLPLFETFWKEMSSRYQQYQKKSQYDDVISYLCFLMSQIMANYCKIDLSQSDLKILLSMAQNLTPEKKQYPLLVFLTHLYLFPYPVYNFLNQNNLYDGFLREVVRIKFDGVILQRIFLLALIKLMEIQQNPQNFEIILISCIQHLKVHCKQRKTTERKIEPRVRNFGEEDEKRQKKQLIENKQNDNELVNLFVKFVHPFDSLSEFDQFKVIYWQNDHNASKLPSDLRASLAAILQTELVQDKPRRIVHIKK